MHRPLDVERCRAEFPALAREAGGKPVVHLDGPAGSQVPRRVIEAVSHYLAHSNANEGGVFPTSRESDALIEEALRAAADLVGCLEPDLVVFGPNMTSLTLSLSRALGRTLGTGDELLITRLDHDANRTPWILAARDAGAVVREVALRRDDCTLDLDDLRAKLGHRTRLLAVGAASNAAGTIHPVGEIVALCHAAGAEVFVDAVHLAPHALLDVAAWDCDYVALSVYKVFGPHVGILWGRRERLAELPVYKLRPAPDELPGRWMTGTQNHEGIAGTLAAVEYLAELGRTVDPGVLSRRAALAAAFAAIEVHERALAGRLLAGLASLAEIDVRGITEPERLAERVPTVSFTHRRRTPREVAEHLACRGIFVWHGHFYAPSVTEDLGLAPLGMVRAGALHYNTAEEVDRLLEALGEID